MSKNSFLTKVLNLHIKDIWCHKKLLNEESQLSYRSYFSCTKNTNFWYKKIFYALTSVTEYLGVILMAENCRTRCNLKLWNAWRSSRKSPMKKQKSFFRGEGPYHPRPSELQVWRDHQFVSLYIWKSMREAFCDVITDNQFKNKIYCVFTVHVTLFFTNNSLTEW